MKIYSKLIVVLFCVLLAVTACSGGGGSEDGTGNSSDARVEWITKWNSVAIDASGRDHQPVGENEARVFGEQIGPVRSARAMAIVHISIADAVAAITGKFNSFLPLVPASPTASVQAAIAQSAHDSLVAMFPSQKPIFDQALAEDLATIADGEDKDAGVALGKTTAANIVEFCQNDGAELSEPYAPITYQPKSAPGKWRPDPMNPSQKGIGASWKKVKPMVLASASQFRIPPPPALNSSEYETAFNEAKLYGGDGVTTPTIRTQDQTDIGLYWAYDGTPSLCAPPRLYNQITVQLGLDQGYDLEQMVRLLAKVNLTMSEAGIASWESKYFYEFWRPITGIREADAGTGPTGAGDGNANTTGDVNFTPLGAPASNSVKNNFTPPFPAYPSGHAVFGAALFETLRNEFGTDNIEFTFVSDELNGETLDNEGNKRPLRPRSFKTLSQAEEENGQSRIYLGIHWQFDKQQGIQQGRNVADYVGPRVYQLK